MTDLEPGIFGLLLTPSLTALQSLANLNSGGLAMGDRRIILDLIAPIYGTLERGCFYAIASTQIDDGGASVTRPLS
jgi:hypothetical protein